MRKLLTIYFVMVLITLVQCVLCFCWPFLGDANARKTNIDEADYVAPWDEQCWIDPMGTTHQPDEKKQSQYTSEQIIRIGRLADGITKRKRYEGGWYRCGHRATDDELIEWSAVWATQIVNINDQYLNYGDEYYLAALAFHESGLDECALGPHVRSKAYQRKLLKKPKRSISHFKAKILTALDHDHMERSFRASGIDIGPCQMLSKNYSQPKNYSNMMTITWGLEECALELNHRGKMYKTDTPWSAWPGTPQEWYQKRIDRMARILKANHDR